MDNFLFAQVLSLNVEALSVAAEVEGMKAENQSRERRGEAQAYSDGDFLEKAHLLSGIAAQMNEVSRA